MISCAYIRTHAWYDGVHINLFQFELVWYGIGDFFRLRARARFCSRRWGNRVGLEIIRICTYVQQKKQQNKTAGFSCLSKTLSILLSGTATPTKQNCLLLLDPRRFFSTNPTGINIKMWGLLKYDCAKQIYNFI